MLQVALAQAWASAKKSPGGVAMHVTSWPGLVPIVAVAPVTLITSPKEYLGVLHPRSFSVTPLGL